MNDALVNSGLVIVDKPQGMTSHDVVSKIRRTFSTKKVGHAGTLDPMATGVLVLGLERGTKFLAHMVASTKSYAATIRLGAATTTDDREGETIASASPDQLAAITETKISDAVKQFRGFIMQRPAAVSAIKIDGKRAHQRVREGEKVEIPARPVTISRYDILEIRRDAAFIDIDVEVDCSSGTYIRSLARDLGEELGVGGHLTALRRTQVGPFTLDNAVTLEKLEENPHVSLTLDQALAASYPVLAVSEKEASDLAMGKWLTPRGLKGIHAAVDPHGRAIALVKEQGKRLATIFVARPSTL
ncbi:tRNA pseudouridine(55) synthase TruB [Corynebacterium diphtheriae]|uniref:tRNA pseudouridine(55) synthase TruB n=1 Tax=Corynebacterium diphtheriae TaxID=1717 RepID=UPI00092786A5|nr:tRNA pseudouridine(55) synthase TruB [Corynebacterium diphtheriae]MBG9302823.1 tRNA pseudouridine(55) synthase TruB [Corynebacterium diphtheriae bv. mitis]MBG9304568.1 tRNA pseudouridine(55) synthase TruB [Corynebacterium diphtheriae bv. mitis]MBG9342624.1 tRNA pseudouridine(55) synthase TruB [Corynebacterium diphtheriae]OJH92364.1 tRNA pseudouridine(55) synthase TruB [Corynebacterium diphtheriae]OSQ05297.1 tRNA pseudouridine(55) synthase TruB [Corynebacterium diphtheriae]